MMSKGASCRIKRTFFVAEQFKSKATRECDRGHVDFHEIGGDNTIRLLKENRFQKRIPQIVLEVVVDTRYGRRG